MIQIDQAQLDRDLAAFSQSVAWKAQFLGVASSKVIKVEANRLAQTLINFTPPAKRQNSEKKIEGDVKKKFELLGKGDESGMLQKYTRDMRSSGGANKRGSGDVRWLLWNSHMLLGISQHYDLRDVNVDGLKAVYYQTKVTKSGRINVGNRGKQAVRLIQRYLTKRATVNALIRKFKSHVGRLKAGWVVGWQKTGSGTGMLSGGRVPDWVMQHVNGGVRGGADVSMMQDSQIPSVKIWNTAKGVGSPYMRNLVHTALEARLNAIPKRLGQLIKLKQKLTPAEYEKLLAQEIA